MDPTNGPVEIVEAAIRPVESVSPNGEFELILSTDGLDRDGDRLWADEWGPMPAKIHLDTDHAFAKGLSVPYTAGSGVPEINENGDLVVRGTFAGTDHGQLTRQLVTEGHVWQASVSYQTHPDGTRELLNGTFCGVPANPEAVVTSSKTKSDKPYGDVRYADPGYQKDGKSRYPIDTEDHVRSALSYFSQAKNRDGYTPAQQRTILGRIRSAARRFGIDTASTDKTLLLALCKAISLASQTTPGHTPGNTDVGARSVYDDPDNEDADEFGDYEDDDDGEDDLAQAVHDAACALGADCTSKTLPSGKTAAADEITAEPTGSAATKSAAPVTPADVAARARVRKFHFDSQIKESEVH